MKIAYVMFDGMTLLDLVGFYDATVRLKGMGFLPDLSWEVCAWTPKARDDYGFHLLPSQVGGSLAGYDLVFLPGGYGTRTLIKDQAFLGWLASAQDCPLKVSVCTGALLWGTLGYLRGKAATTHPGAYELLRPLCARVVEDRRVVDEGAIITARGVSSSLDLGLYVCQRLAGPAATQAIRKQMDYPYGPVPG